MALIEYQTSKFSVTSPNSIDCAANTKPLEGSRNTRQRLRAKRGNGTCSVPLRDWQARFVERVRMSASLTVEEALPYGLGIDGRKSTIFILPKDFRFGR